MPGPIPKPYSNTPQRGIRNTLNNIVPAWLSNKPGLNTGFKILWCIALISDFIVDMALQGFRAAMGYGTSTAIPMMAASRGLLQGVAETNKHFLVRLYNWLNYWMNAGQTEILAQMIQNYLPNNPIVRIVDRTGNWVTANQDGTTTFSVDASWNWDGILNPERKGWWSDFWVIVYPDPWPTWNSNGNAGGWTNSGAQTQWSSGNNQGLGFGHQVPQYIVQGINQIVATWKGAHTYLVAMCFTDVASLFVPGQLSNPGNPDGTWGNWGKVTPTGSYPSRTTELYVSGVYQGHVRYWTPKDGG